MQNLKPKKHLGQHFLADGNIARKIVSLLAAPPSATVVEIGPGMGVLTKLLMEHAWEVHAVEFDADAVAYLQQQVGEGSVEGRPGSLQVHHSDILAWDPSKHLGGPAYFIGNLPYNVSSPIMFHLLEHRAHVEQGVFMVQKEVADRICAVEGGPVRERGILTILLDCYFELNRAFTVPPTVFRPPPKVNSAVFTMRRREGVEVPFGPLAKVVKAAFGQRRKTLRNALKGLAFRMEEVPADWWEKRAEVLGTADFVRLAGALVGGA